MDFFSDALARLKHQLRVSKDGEVATVLGLSKTAFSERKKRGSFPEKELAALARERPELEIDVSYILTGKTQREAAWELAAGPQIETASEIERLQEKEPFPGCPQDPAKDPSAGGPGSGTAKISWRDILVMVVELNLPEKKRWSWKRTVEVVDLLHDMEQRGVTLSHDVVRTLIKAMA